MPPEVYIWYKHLYMCIYTHICNIYMISNLNFDSTFAENSFSYNLERWLIMQFIILQVASNSDVSSVEDDWDGYIDTVAGCHLLLNFCIFSESGFYWGSVMGTSDQLLSNFSRYQNHMEKLESSEQWVLSPGVLIPVVLGGTPECKFLAYYKGYTYCWSSHWST